MSFDLFEHISARERRAYHEYANDNYGGKLQPNYRTIACTLWALYPCSYLNIGPIWRDK